VGFTGVVRHFGRVVRFLVQRDGFAGDEKVTRVSSRKGAGALDHPRSGQRFSRVSRSPSYFFVGPTTVTRPMSSFLNGVVVSFQDHPDKLVALAIGLGLLILFFWVVLFLRLARPTR